MKLCCNVIFLLLLFISVTVSETVVDSLSDSTASVDSSLTLEDTTSMDVDIDNLLKDDDKGVEDDFSSFEDLIGLDEEEVDSADLTEEIDYSEDESSEERPVDWKIDISVSGIVPVYKPHEESLRLESSSKSSFSFDLGVNLLFLNNHLFTSLSARYLNISFDVDRIESSSKTQVIGTTLADIYSTEELHYVTMPLAVGARYTMGAFTPYLFGEMELAYLSAATLHSRVELSSKFSNGAVLEKTYVNDDDVIEYRKKTQLFCGGGLGLDFNYGYGIVYVESAFKRAVYQHDKGDDEDITKPARGKGDLSFIPITVGLRFYF